MPEFTCSLPLGHNLCSLPVPSCSPEKETRSSDLFPALFLIRERGTCSLFPHRRWGTGNNPAAGTSSHAGEMP
jgi:hypothetical protein